LGSNQFYKTETGIQKAANTYLIEFINDGNLFIDFDRGGCSAKFSIREKGAINLEPFSYDACSNFSKYAQDLQKLLLSSTAYSIDGDSVLTLSGRGEIKLKRSLDCGHGLGGPCQTNIVYISMTIKKTDGSNVLLTGAKLVRLSDNYVIYMESNNGVIVDQPNLRYTLISDSHRKVFAGKKVEVEFQGFINDTIVVRRTFTITADCCHVALISGDLDIVLN
jgi:hypothetical protein